MMKQITVHTATATFFYEICINGGGNMPVFGPLLSGKELSDLMNFLETSPD
jgi:hypothetical protein